MNVRGTNIVRPTLFCAPVFWTREFWTSATHQWDWVRPETPLSEKPWIEFDISLDVTLGEVFAAACDSWGIEEGPDQLERGFKRENQFMRFGFVDPERDAEGLGAGVGRNWPYSLPIPRGDGAIDQVPALKATYRDLLVSAELGLIEGDVMRPYVHPVPPQGDPGVLIEAGRLAVEAIRAAYTTVDDGGRLAGHTIKMISASLPRAEHDANELVDEGVRVAAVVAFARWVKQKFRKTRRD